MELPVRPSAVEAVCLYLGRKFLKSEYRRKWSPSNPTLGFCYVVSEAIYHYAEEKLVPKVVRIDGIGTHWWLEREDGTILDYTAKQFDLRPPYELGRRAAFFKGAVPTSRGTISRRGYAVALGLSRLGQLPRFTSS